MNIITTPVNVQLPAIVYILSFILAGLKLVGLFSFSWFWVVSPIVIPVILLFVYLIFLMVFNPNSKYITRN